MENIKPVQLQLVAQNMVPVPMGRAVRDRMVQKGGAVYTLSDFLPIILSL